MRRVNKSTFRDFFVQIWMRPKWFVVSSIIVSLLTSTISEVCLFNCRLLNSAHYYSWTRFFGIALLSVGFINLCRYHKYLRQNLDKAFLLICMTVGLSFIFVFPQVVHVSPDDHIHLRNAFVFLHNEVHWSDGIKMLDSAIDTSTVKMSIAEIDAVHEKINEAHTASQDDTMSFINDYDLYSRLVYLPYHIGFEISQFLRLQLTDMLIVAKTCNYLCYVILIYFAIKISTRARKIFFAVGLITSNIFYATQFSYDPMITASIMLALALFIRMLEQDKIHPKYPMGFVLLVIWASLPKAIYCPLLLLPLIIPSRKFSDNYKRAILLKTLIVILTIIMLSSFVLPALSGGMSGDMRGGNTSVGGQMGFIMSHPLQFMIILTRFILTNVPSLIFGQAVFVNLPVISHSIFGEEAMYISQPTYYAELVLVLWATFTTVWRKSILPYFRKTYFVIIYLAISLAIIGGLYLSFTEIGADTVMGVQHRYFMPILPLLLLVISPVSKREVDNSTGNSIPIFCWYACLASPILLFLFRVSFGL